MPSADYKVEIVDSSGEADMTVAVIGDQVVDLTGATDGQVLTIQPDGTVAPENPGAPVAHAATHAAAGSDPVTLTQAQISGLVDALAAKLAINQSPEPLFQLANGNYATATNYSPGSAIALPSQTLRLRYFTARSATPINAVATYCQVAHSVVAPTVARIGIWSLDANGIDLAALVASTANDTSLFAATGKITKALQAQWTPVVGQRYATGVLVVTAGTTAQLAFASSLLSSTGSVPIEGRAANGWLTGQADLPPSSNAIVTQSSGPYVEFIP